MYNFILVLLTLEIRNCVAFASSSINCPFIKSESELTLPCFHYTDGDGESLVRCGLIAARIAPYNCGFCLQTGSCWICRTADYLGLQAEEVQITTNFFLIGMPCCYNFIFHAKRSLNGFPVLKQLCCNINKISVTGCSEHCHVDNIQYSQWWQFQFQRRGLARCGLWRYMAT